ncbi:DsbE family thiol:disulfide interchange protein [Thalassobaculum litoreum]|uniref:Cytochrome c biogenesis protein CcmG, thiol:disulfide interchange protein DsbE n=1 Tax=Thalassobaculum litoreum DSM 18839 TaxID=1123362 RepID=A0A8G2BIY3_9PROT|nr:DsbE family thiol:disulfide interchange protein [Thalassobaculum litoreum]SDF52951.1 cytochrome c biogenesis protein CcmG, thiol:disulfide interchange protein DsbE [Thalassobaculum litoreum DSM 18839]
MRRLFALIPLAAAVALVAALAWPILDGRNPQELPSVLLDKPVPAFDLPGLEPGAPGLASADLAGKPVLVNVFASWCAPCRAEIPRLQALAGDGVTVYGLAYKDDPVATRRFLSDLGNPYARIGVDRDGRTGIEFGVYGVPETYVIDGSGVIRHRHVGEVTDRVAEATLVPLLKELEQ